MAIYGFGAMFGEGNNVDVSDEFRRQEMACLGWSREGAPPLFEMLLNIQNGDLVFIKTFNPQQGLTIKAVGIVTDRTVRSYLLHEEARHGGSVKWVWKGRDNLGQLGDKAPARTGTLYQEFSPEVQRRVVEHLLSVIAGSDA